MGVSESLFHLRGYGINLLDSASTGLTLALSDQTAGLLFLGLALIGLVILMVIKWKGWDQGVAASAMPRDPLGGDDETEISGRSGD